MLVLRDKKERILLHLNARVRILAEEHGRNPADLEEFTEWDDSPLPAHPVPGEDWTYDPQTGQIS